MEMLINKKRSERTNYQTPQDPKQTNKSTTNDEGVDFIKK